MRGAATLCLVLLGGCHDWETFSEHFDGAVESDGGGGGGEFG